MKILHVIDSINAVQGGPSVSVPSLAREQAKLGHEVTIVCRDYGYLGPMARMEGVQIRSIPSSRWTKGQGGWGCSFRRLVEEEARKADVVHNHGLWLAANYYARRAAKEAGKPLVISTRGMVEGWSLRRARVRKFVAWQLFERKNLESAALFHATSESEAEAIATALRIKMKIKFKEPRIVVAPNGVDIPKQIPNREALEARFAKLRGKKWVLFMSRIHPKKGLDLLLEAWKQQLAAAPSGLGLAPSDLPPPIQGSASRGNENPLTRGNSRLGLSEVVLVIAGADLIGYGKEVERMIREKGLGETVLMTGHVDGEVREALLGHSMFLVLPSHSENFGLVVAESLAAGRPALTTTGTPWGMAAKQPGDGRWKMGDGVVGPLRPAPAHPSFPLRGWMAFRWRGGIREREGERERGPSFAPNLAGSGGATESGCAGWDMNLERNGCGVICEVGGLKEALGRMLGFSDEELDQMGKRGRRMVAERFSWKSSAEKVVDAYKTLV